MTEPVQAIGTTNASASDLTNELVFEFCDGDHRIALILSMGSDRERIVVDDHCIVDEVRWASASDY
ncbi:MAG: hypothetical protein ACI8W7_004228, partial [Gammaproteobacteria bacterium]